MSRLDVLLVDYLLMKKGIVNVTPCMLVRERERMLEVFKSEEECIKVLYQYLGGE